MQFGVAAAAAALAVCLLALALTASAGRVPFSESALGRRMSMLSTQQGVQLGDEDLCNNCQLLVTTFVMLVENNATMQALEDFLDKECTSIGLPSSLAELCEKLLANLITHDPYSPFAVCSILDLCTVNCCLTETQPEQIHIAVGSDPNQMVVTWVTQSATKTVTARVQTKGGPISEQTGSSHTYKAGGWNGTINVVQLTGLTPDTLCSYQVGDATGGWSQWFSFRSAPPDVSYGTTTAAPATDLPVNWPSIRFAPAAASAHMRHQINAKQEAARTFQWAVIGDMGVARSQQTITPLSALAANFSMDMVLHVGDISYADGNQQQWDIFLRLVQPIAATIPYMVIPGNHEGADFAFGSYKNRFEMPSSSAASTRGGRSRAKRRSYTDSLGNMYYSFNYGPVHFIGISTETTIELPNVTPEGLAFLQADLKVADSPTQRARQPWIVVMQHRPLYCTTNRMDCHLFAEYLRMKLEAIYIQYHVDLVFAGHVHNYERTFPVANGVAVQLNYSQPAAPIYIVDGAAGNREGLYTARDSPVPSWSAYRDVEYGFGWMSVPTPVASPDGVSTSLRFQFIRDSDLSIKDDFTVTKQIQL